MSLQRAKSSSAAPAEYNIVVVGSGGVGKSALSVQFVQARFLDEYDPTIIDAYKKQCVIDDELASLEIIDTGDYTALGDSYMQNGDGFILVFALDSRGSFQEMAHIQQQVLRVKDAETFPMVLVGNKSDLDAARQVSTTEARELARDFGCRYVETSAKARHNVEDVFHGVVREVRKRRREERKAAKRDKTGSCIIL